MKYFIVYLRKECLRVWLAILLVLLATVLSVVCAVQIGHSRSEWITTILPDVFKVAAWVIAACTAMAMGYEDSPRRENHYLSTRPIDRRIMYDAKALIVILFAIILGTGQFITSTALGLDQNLWENFLCLVLFGLLLLFAGAHLRLSVRYAVLWGISLIAISVVVSLANMVAQLLQVSPSEPQLALALGIILAFFIAAFHISYRIGENARLTVIAIAVYTFLVASINFVSFEGKTIPADELAKTLNERKPISLLINGASEGNFTITPMYEPTSVGSPNMLVVEAKNPELRDASGNLMDHVSSKQIVTARTVDPNETSNIPYGAYLSDADSKRMLEWSTERAYFNYGRSLLVKTPPGFATEDEEITVSYTPVAKVFRLENLGEIPFRIGQTLRSKDFLISVGDVRAESDRGVSLAGRKTRLDVHWRADKGERIYVILSSEKTGEFWTSDLRNSSEFTIPGETSAISYSSITYDNRSRTRKPLQLIPPDATLRFFRYVDLGEKELPRISETTSFGEIFRTGITRPLIARYPLRSSVSASRPVPLLGDQIVSEYLRSLESYSDGSIYQSLAIRETLSEIARTDPEELLEYLKQENSAPSLSNSIVNALTAAAPSRIVPQVVALLPDDPSLATFLAMRGWPDSDKIREVAEQEENASYEVRRSLAYYGDDISLDILLENLGRLKDAVVYRRLLESESHRERAEDVYQKIEASFIKRLRTESLNEVRESEARFLLETGSMKTYRAILEKISDPDFFRSRSELYYLLGERTLKKDFSRRERYNEALATFPKEVSEAPKNALRFDQVRHYFIFTP